MCSICGMTLRQGSRISRLLRALLLQMHRGCLRRDNCGDRDRMQVFPPTSILPVTTDRSSRKALYSVAPAPATTPRPSRYQHGRGRLTPASARYGRPQKRLYGPPANARLGPPVWMQARCHCIPPFSHCHQVDRILPRTFRCVSRLAGSRKVNACAMHTELILRVPCRVPRSGGPSASAAAVDTAKTCSNLARAHALPSRRWDEQGIWRMQSKTQTPGAGAFEQTAAVPYRMKSLTSSITVAGQADLCRHVRWYSRCIAV